MLWHFVFESLAYFLAFQIYLRQRRATGDFLSESQRWQMVAAAIAGAAIGAKLLYWFEDPAKTWQHGLDISYLMGGKTVIGAILGGTISVELSKRATGIASRTGDLFAIPLAFGIAVGRIGCFLAGLHDDTYGSATTLPWGVDFGDGVRRHPVELYECAAMLLLVPVLRQVIPPKFERGDRFRLFLLAYFSWRLCVDCLKPGVRFAGLTVLQWTCLLALIWYSKDLVHLLMRATRKAEVLKDG